VSTTGPHSPHPLTFPFQEHTAAAFAFCRFSHKRSTLGHGRLYSPKLRAISHLHAPTDSPLQPPHLRRTLRRPPIPTRPPTCCRLWATGCSTRRDSERRVHSDAPLRSRLPAYAMGPQVCAPSSPPASHPLCFRHLTLNYPITHPPSSRMLPLRSRLPAYAMSPQVCSSPSFPPTCQTFNVMGPSVRAAVAPTSPSRLPFLDATRN
jgi:hypothetical protein